MKVPHITKDNSKDKWVTHVAEWVGLDREAISEILTHWTNNWITGSNHRNRNAEHILLSNIIIQTL